MGKHDDVKQAGAQETRQKGPEGDIAYNTGVPTGLLYISLHQKHRQKKTKGNH